MNAETALRELCSAWERLDAGAVALLFSQEGRYEDPLFDPTPVGPAAIRAEIASAMSDLAEVRNPMRVLLASDELVMAEGQFLSTVRSGGRLDFPLVIIIEMRDGLIGRFAEYFDTGPLKPSPA